MIATLKIILLTYHCHSNILPGLPVILSESETSD